MNVNNSARLLQYSFMSRIFSNITGNPTAFSNPLDRMSSQYRNRHEDTNVAKVNTQGLTGMIFESGSPESFANRQIIGISEEGKQKIFNMVKSEFMSEKGVMNGDTTRRTEVYAEYLRGVPEKDRAKVSWTLDRLESEYWRGFADAAKQADPDWKPGRDFDYDVIQGITREDVSGDIDRQSSMGFDARA